MFIKKHKFVFVLLSLLIASGIVLSVYGGNIDINEAQRVLDKKSEAMIIPSAVETQPDLGSAELFLSTSETELFTYNEELCFNLDNFDIAILSLELTDRIELSDGSKIEIDNESESIVKLNIKMTNNSNDTIDFNSMSFFINQKGVSYNNISYLDRVLLKFEAFSKGALQIGETRIGAVYFKVKDFDFTEVVNFKVHYKNETYICNIGSVLSLIVQDIVSTSTEEANSY